MRVWQALLLLLLAVAPLAAQEEEPPPVGVKIVSLEVEPPPANRSLFKLLELKEGERFSPEALRSSLENIFRLGIYSDVRALWQYAGDGIALTLMLEEMPVIEGVTVRGSGPVSKRAVIRAARLDRNIRYSAEREEEIINAVTRLYRSRGYWATDVSLYSMVNLETGGMRLEIAVDPGGPTELRSVKFKGFPVLSTEEILGAMRSTGLRKPFLQEDLKQDLKRLERFYIERDYLTADIVAGEPHYDREANAVDLELTINAGPLIKLSFVPEDRSARNWKKLIPFQDRNVPLQRIVENGKSNIERSLRGPCSE